MALLAFTHLCAHAYESVTTVNIDTYGTETKITVPKRGLVRIRLNHSHDYNTTSIGIKPVYPNYSLYTGDDTKFYTTKFQPAARGTKFYVAKDNDVPSDATLGKTVLLLKTAKTFFGNSIRYSDVNSSIYSIFPVISADSTRSAFGRYRLLIDNASDTDLIYSITPKVLEASESVKHYENQYENLVTVTNNSYDATITQPDFNVFNDPMCIGDGSAIKLTDDEIVAKAKATLLRGELYCSGKTIGGTDCKKFVSPNPGWFDKYPLVDVKKLETNKVRFTFQNQGTGIVGCPYNYKIYYDFTINSGKWDLVYVGNDDTTAIPNCSTATVTKDELGRYVPLGSGQTAKWKEDVLAKNPDAQLVTKQNNQCYVAQLAFPFNWNGGNTQVMTMIVQLPNSANPPSLPSEPLETTHLEVNFSAKKETYYPVNVTVKPGQTLTVDLKDYKSWSSYYDINPEIRLFDMYYSDKPRFISSSEATYSSMNDQGSRRVTYTLPKYQFDKKVQIRVKCSQTSYGNNSCTGKLLIDVK